MGARVSVVSVYVCTYNIYNDVPSKVKTFARPHKSVTIMSCVSIEGRAVVL